MRRSLLFAIILALPLAMLAGLAAYVGIYGEPGPGRDYVLRIDLPAAEQEIGLPEVLGPADTQRPLIVLDPGHGGHDPGAGKGEVKEKLIALQLAQAIRDELVDGGGIRVALTRSGDRYLMLAERTEIARKLGADLFLSIHADSTDNDVATGASVYVLSEKGSSQAAEQMAERENKADMLWGVDVAESSDSVSAILFDLSQREAQAGSEEMAGLILRELDGKIPLHRSTVQSAAFGVLKSPDMPSVLFETGFISNPTDARFLSSHDGQDMIAKGAVRAIRAFFARRSGA